MCTVSQEPNLFICIFPPRLNGSCLLRPNSEGPFDRVAVYLGRFFADWAEGVGDCTRREEILHPIEVREQTTPLRISLYDNIPINAIMEEAPPSIGSAAPRPPSTS